MTGVPALREAVAAKIEALLRPPLRPGQRDHHHRRRHAGDHHRHPRRGAPRRRGDRAGALLRQLRAQHRAGRRHRGARAADAGHLPARLRQDRRGDHQRTRAIIVNSPHNPSATVWSRDDMLRLQELLAPTDVLLISDEVYEHMVFDGQAAPERGALSRAWRRARSSSRASARPTT